MHAQGWVALFAMVVACGRAERQSAPAIEAVQPAPTPPPSAAKPALRLIVVSELEGVLEPCGCSRDVHGGVDRLVTAIHRARADAEHAGVSSLLIAAGDMLYGPVADVRQQDVWGAELLVDVLSRLHVDVVAPGAEDLAHPIQLASLSSAVWLGETLWNPIARSVWSRSALVDAGELTTGFVRVDPAATVAAVQQDVASLRERAALVVAIVGSAYHELAADTNADVVVQIGADATFAASSLANEATLLLAPGRHAESLLIADLWLGAGRWREVSDGTDGRGFRVEHSTLDSQIPSDSDTRSALDQLFARANSYNQKHPDAPPPAVMRAESYAGSDTCAACHTRAYFWWQTSAHSRAFETLVKRGRQFDRDCIGCHVTGYDRPGGATLASVEHVAGVGCESCHGPGSDHANNPRAASVSLRRAVPEATCRGCHDAEHHAAFRYQNARPLLLSRDHGQR